MGDACRPQCFRGTGMEVRSDVKHLLIGHRHRRHPFVGASQPNDLADLVALYVMSNER